MTILSQLFLSLTSAITLGLAFTWPGTLMAAMFGWISVFGLILLAYQPRANFALFSVGLVSHTIGFHWLLDTIAKFGGFGYLPAVLIFLLFISTASLQFIIFGWLVKVLPEKLRLVGLAAPLAWCSLEYIFPRIFPWEYSHTQLNFGLLVQGADLVGSQIVSFLMFWLIAGGISAWRCSKPLVFITPALLTLAALLYGVRAYTTFEASSQEIRQVSIIQANISIEDKHNQLFFAKNTDQYKALSTTLPDDGRLIIWPETVITELVNSQIKSSSQDSRLPQPSNKNSFLVGTLAATPKNVGLAEIHNSAVAIKSGGSIAGFYHKQILMPFGEYVPFATTFPWLLDLARMEGQFTAGKQVEVFELANGIRAAPLICYEDLVPSLSREAVRQGANLIVNITNDAWFGKSGAPLSHNAMASFRAIENRRFLIRSTNSGLTSIIDPLGRMVSSLEPFSEGILNAKVGLMQETTIFTRYLGAGFWAILTGITLIIAIARWFSGKIR